MSATFIQLIPVHKMALLLVRSWPYIPDKRMLLQAALRLYAVHCASTAQAQAQA